MIIPEPILVGRNEVKLRRIAEQHGLTRWTTDLAEALAEPDVEIYFDSQLTQLREKGVRAAVEAGKHDLLREADRREPGRRGRPGPAGPGRRPEERRGAGQAVLPGLRKLKRLVDGGFFGRILSVRGEFGYWVFEGDWQEAQRPSWNYKLRRGRRHHRRHVLPLAVRARPDLRPGQVGLLPGRRPTSRPAVTNRARSTPPPPTTRRTACSSWRAGSSRR